MTDNIETSIDIVKMTAPDLHAPKYTAAQINGADYPDQIHLLAMSAYQHLEGAVECQKTYDYHLEEAQKYLANIRPLRRRWLCRLSEDLP
jgi:hypothetical protein